jgi:hypothetical protein
MRPNLNIALGDYQFIAEDMLIYTNYKNKQIKDKIALESNFNKRVFLRSQHRWIIDLSKAIEVFKSDDDYLISIYMAKVDDIENEVSSLVSDD